MKSKQESDRQFVAIETSRCAFSLIARSLSSRYLQDAILIYRRFSNVANESAEYTGATILLLKSLAHAPELLNLKTIIQNLARSLPCILMPEYSANEKRAVLINLEALAAEALTLHAPEVAQKVGALIDILRCGSVGSKTIDHVDAVHSVARYWGSQSEGKT